MSILKKDANMLSSSANKTLKKECSHGIMYYRSTNRGEKVFFVLAKPTYSYNKILYLIGEISTLYIDHIDERKLSNNIYDLMRQYDANPQEEDSFSKARTTIESATSSVKENVEKVMKNST